MAKKKAKKAPTKRAPAKKAAAKGGRKSKVEPVLVFDTETGGFDPRKNSLLTVAFAAVNPKTWEIMSSIDLKIKSDTYKVTGGALKVNKIDIAKHDADKNALSPSDAVETIIDFLKKNFKLPAKPAGQNTPFDIGFVTELFNSVGAKYNDFIHYSYLDTMPVLRLLALMGEIPDSACSLQGAKRHFGIKQKRSAAHDAMGDVEATVQVFKALIEGLSSVEGGAVDSDDEEETEEPEPKKKRASKKSKKDEEEEEEEDEDEEDEEEPEDLDELEDDDDEEEEDDEDEDDEEDDDDEDEEEDDEDEDDWEDD